MKYQKLIPLNGAYIQIGREIISIINEDCYGEKQIINMVGKEAWDWCVVGRVFLDRVIRVGLIKKVTLESRFEERENEPCIYLPAEHTSLYIWITTARHQKAKERWVSEFREVTWRSSQAIIRTLAYALCLMGSHWRTLSKREIWSILNMLF